ncbi:hypothetical protein [Caulobacter sp. NIBR2454]|uniref:hypothetical protein n=1 Tax=Caulobacter sp. NIBR2454 TaxID=3015996 RepID=UPI0022B6C391|nr:hypothetical protein [Caulobacter sp. NIBR2454]
MKRPFLATAGVLCFAGLALAACGPDGKPPKPSNNHWNDKAMTVKSRLDCPEKQGVLTRVSAAADGKSCVYTGDDAEITLRQIAIGPDGARAALAPIESELRALVPYKAKPPEKTGEHTEIRLPGLHITAQDDSSGGSAQVRVAGVHINADDNGAEIRAENFGENSVKASLILAGDKIPTSDHPVVGYEARGPVKGPLIVAVVKSKGKDYHNDGNGAFMDMKRLVKRNTNED